MAVLRPGNRATISVVAFVALLLVVYTVSYFAMSEVRELPLPDKVTPVRVFESQVVYRSYTPLRWVETAATGRQTAYRE